MVRLLLALVVASGCGSGESPTVGGPCEVDGDCSSGICWDFADHDSLCFGKVCSAECQTDDDCIALATSAAASVPANASCGSDLQCDLVTTGLGSFSCARR